MDQYSHGGSFRLRVWHIGLLLLIFFFCMFAAFALTGRSKLEREIAAIRAAGYPTNFEELEKYYSIPEGVPNAADVYSKAFDAYQEPSGELVNYLSMYMYRADRLEPLDPNSVKAIISGLQANKETLEFLDKAAAIEHCRYDVDFSPAGILNIPYLTEIRGCAQLLAEQTMLLAHQGDGDAAAKNIARQLALAQSLKKEPILLSQIMRMISIGISRWSVEYTLNRTTLTDEQLTALQQRLSQVYQDEPMVMGLIGERCWVSWLIDNPQQLRFPGAVGGLMRITGVADRNAQVSLELFGQYIDTLKLPGHQRLLRSREISAEMDDLSFFYSLTKRGLPAFRNTRPERPASRHPDRLRQGCPGD